MTNLPIATQNEPYQVELEAGDYKWCACGLSQKQPFCDGAHSGSGLHSVKFSLAEKETKFLCGCRQTKTPPFCDGSHSGL